MGSEIDKWKMSLDKRVSSLVGILAFLGTAVAISLGGYASCKAEEEIEAKKEHCTSVISKAEAGENWYTSARLMCQNPCMYTCVDELALKDPVQAYQMAIAKCMGRAE